MRNENKMAWELWNKYEQLLEKDIQNYFQSINNIQTKINSINIIIPDNVDQNQILAYTSYWSQIKLYFIYCNGGLGYDTFIAKRFLSHMLIYWLISSDKSISDDDKEICYAEIETAFYVILNCIYNIKEKWHKFLNTSKDKNTIIYSILNSEGQNFILNKLNFIYGEIKNLYCARRCLVHDVYQIFYNRNKDLISIGKSEFTLSEKKVWENDAKKSIYQFKIIDIFDIYEKIELSRYEILNALSNINNVDLSKLNKKYLDYGGEYYKYSII
jgi:hypothetical protein